MDYSRLNDIVLERTANNGPQPPCQFSKQALEEGGEVPSSVQDVEEELVDFGEDEEDIVGSVPGERKGLAVEVLLEDKSDPPVPGSDQVQPCNL